MTDPQSRIADLAELPQNWDSHGANPLAPGVVLRALELVELLGEGWYAFPCHDGGIQFEHDNDDEIVVKPDGTYEVLLCGLDLGLAEIDALMKARRA